MRSALKDVVRLGGLALQAEDCSIRAAVYHRGERGGLVKMENVRHHQFRIIWRAVLPIWHAELERDDNTDIIIGRDGTRHYFELKNWRGASGNDQIPDIRKDVSKLRRRENGYLLITSGNPRDLTDENIKYLLSKVSGLDNSQRKDYRFATEDEKGSDREYWIAGWPLEKSAGNVEPS
jgi:hypothetical protein